MKGRDDILPLKGNVDEILAALSTSRKIIPHLEKETNGESGTH